MPATAQQQMMMPEGPCQQCYLPTRRTTITTVTTTTTTTANEKNPPADQQTAGSDNMVAMTFQRGSQGGGRGRGRSSGAGMDQQHAETAQATETCAPQSYEEYRDMPCLAHIDPATGKSTHTNRHFKWVNDLKSDPEAGYKRAQKPRPRGKGGKGKKEMKAAGEDMDEDDA